MGGIGYLGKVGNPPEHKGTFIISPEGKLYEAKTA